jgi:putative ABC transport system permease protein
VVGVVRDVLERGYEQDPKPGVYVSQLQGPRFSPTVNLIVRVDGDPLSYAPAVERVVREVDPDQPIRLVRTMTDVIGLTVGDRRQQTTLLVAFGALALVIASLGLHGLLAQTVSARSREIGIRMALGATWRNVMRMVMSRGIVLTSTGVAIGTMLAWSVTRALGTLLYGVSATDPLTFALVTGCSPQCPSRRAPFPPCAPLASIRCSSCASSSGADAGTYRTLRSPASGYDRRRFE